MPRRLDPRIREILERYGEDPADTENVIWDCRGKWVVLHQAVERIAATAGVVFERPTILRQERDEAVILVSGKLGDRWDWEIGEAVVGVNYQVTGKQAAYVWAMATKRARDRLVLKLVGLQGLIYSEEEADDFKDRAPARRDEPRSGGRAERPDEPDGNDEGEPDLVTRLKAAIDKQPSVQAVTDYMKNGKVVAALEQLDEGWVKDVRDHAVGRLEALGWAPKRTRAPAVGLAPEEVD